MCGPASFAAALTSVWTAWQSLFTFMYGWHGIDARPVGTMIVWEWICLSGMFQLLCAFCCSPNHLVVLVDQILVVGTLHQQACMLFLCISQMCLFSAEQVCLSHSVFERAC